MISTIEAWWQGKRNKIGKLQPERAKEGSSHQHARQMYIEDTGSEGNQDRSTLMALLSTSRCFLYFSLFL